MYDQGFITKEEQEEALADDVYDRIQNVDTATKETNNHYSYFTDELIEQVITALMEKLDYTESQASNLLYSGGLQIYTTQDPDPVSYTHLIVSQQGRVFNRCLFIIAAPDILNRRLNGVFPAETGRAYGPAACHLLKPFHFQVRKGVSANHVPYLLHRMPMGNQLVL